ncbi:MAG: helix-turn-helix domain-containing protein [Proteobacteria bacterium]|nr:helix-turn-helix domain-containing protein [Pseudomonadota bacterium]
MFTHDHDAPSVTAIRHLNQLELARRWRMSERTLERWRWLKKGPTYLKVGGHVVYRFEDVLAYEQAQLHGADGQAASITVAVR